MRVGVAGLVHGHVRGFYRLAEGRKDIEIVGVAEPDKSLAMKYKAPVHFSTLEEMLDRAKPEAVVTFTNTFDHRRVVETCAARGVHVMVEKPLAVGVEHGRAIAAAAKRGKIHVVTNYETTWYPVNTLVWKAFREEELGAVWKVIVRDGHKGPREIGVPPEFFNWLSDPQLNGAGALYDFGCYGVNILTSLMDGAKPQSVFAQTQRTKPHIYPKVDDDATILLQYPQLDAVIQASWVWPYSRKDLDLYGLTGTLTTLGPDKARIRKGDGAEEVVTGPSLTAPNNDYVTYLKALVRGELTPKPADLSSLENNLIVTEVLAAARESAKTGRRISME